MIACKPQRLALAMPTKFLALLVLSGFGGTSFTHASVLSSSVRDIPGTSLRGALPDLPIVLSGLDPGWWKATTPPPKSADEKASNGSSQASGTAQSSSAQSGAGENKTAIFTPMWEENTTAYMCTPISNIPGSYMATKDYWSDECKRIPGGATYISITIGTKTDYFKPTSGATLCDMLTNSNKHQWSADVKNWVTPTYAVKNGQPYALGGSGQGWPASQDGEDHRFALPFWGVLPGTTSTGGCCAQDDKASSESWSLPFKMSSCGSTKSLTPICTPLVSSAGKTPENFPELCKQVPATTTFIRLSMGDYVDYFRPVTGKTYCEMLSTPKNYDWSKDGSTWTELPDTAFWSANYVGGTSPSYKLPEDDRKQLPLWYDTSGTQGACGQNVKGDATYRCNNPYMMSFCEIPVETPIASMVKSMQETEEAVKNLEIKLDGLHSHLLEAEKTSVDAAGNVSIARRGIFKLAAKFADEADQMSSVQKVASLSGTHLESVQTQLSGAKGRIQKNAGTLSAAATVANKTATPQALAQQDALNDKMWTLLDPNNEDNLDATEQRIRDIATEENKFKAQLTEDVKTVMMTKMRRKVQTFRKAIMRLGNAANTDPASRLGEVAKSRLGDDIGFEEDED